MDFQQNEDISLNLQGNINSADDSESTAGIPNTLDEPVKDTILRDLTAIGLKLRHVFYPTAKSSLLKEWDLWGPLVLCVAMAMLLHTNTIDEKDTGGPEFAEVFVIFWIGAMLVTANIKLLGGHISLFQSICVLGYCVLPLVIALILCNITLYFPQHQTTVLFLIRLLLVSLAIAWSIYAASGFLADCQPRSKIILSSYPIFLFYIVIGWLILSH